MKAIHNAFLFILLPCLAVSESQRYKFWKQFTTAAKFRCCKGWLFLKVKDTNFESNSQLKLLNLNGSYSCFWKSKIQILKAIHNAFNLVKCWIVLFLKVKDTNFESNSQLPVWFYFVRLSCFWKSKIQILKAIHNLLTKPLQRLRSCFWKSKIQILKAIHNIVANIVVYFSAVSESQRYKFWKQFTTQYSENAIKDALFLKVKDTNFESNSQQLLYISNLHMCCFWKSKIQILKAIHNAGWLHQSHHNAVSESQRYKFWKQFTTMIYSYIILRGCFWKSKIQILKAIHNISFCDSINV